MTLVIGYGNPGRGDDGLGPRLATWAAEQGLPGLEVICDFQLKVEHAISVAAASRVLFVDACLECDRAFRISPVSPSAAAGIDSHSVDPAAVMGLASLLFGASPPADVLAIAGTDFDMLEDELSAGALRNLAEAQQGFLRWYAQASPEAASAP